MTITIRMIKRHDSDNITLSDNGEYEKEIITNDDYNIIKL